jgi:hypothetical protein
MSDELHSVQRERMFRPRYVLAAAGAALILAAGASAVGAAHHLFGRQGTDARVPGIVGDRVHELLSLPSPAGEVGLWIGPTQAGGRCVYLHIGDQAASGPSSANGGSQCDVGPSTRQTTPINTNLTWYPVEGSFTLVIDGHVAPDSRIAALELRSAAGARLLPLVKGYFLGDIPVAPQGQLPAEGAPYVLVGSGKDGREVARVDLRRLAQSPSR